MPYDQITLDEDFHALAEEAAQAYYIFQPRPDDPARYDQQAAFVNSQSRGVSFLVGGNGAGCLAAETEIYDPVLKKSRRVDSVTGPFHVWALDESGNRVIAAAQQPRIYGRADLYEIQLSNGLRFIATLDHRVFSAAGWISLRALSNVMNGLLQSVPGVLCRASFPKCGPHSLRKVYITAIRFVRQDVYWDFHVPVYENYEHAGIWHHNTTECAMHKIARFLMATPPPRHDTPFWIIGDSYEQAMDACWKEKLYGHGHLPRSEIDFDRISYYKPNLNWPFRVALRPWPGRPDKNWMLEFKSYEQGRRALQAKSLGGFCFSEQFPWSLLTEVLRGCREYNFPGSKFAEFTPVDPALSWELENMDREQRLPPGWEIFRANTEVAKEFGHIDDAWYEEFFGMMAPEEIDVRKIGAWASFAGQIYQAFNPAIHTVTEMNFPPGVQHRRVIDFGSGPENAFVCLWAYRNGVGQWFVYDEYWSTSQSLDMLDHFERILERHPWPEQMRLSGPELLELQPFYGPTWADPSSPDNIRLAMKLDFPIQPAANAVHEGIDCVRRHLKISKALGAPRLIINRRTCPNLFREMATYRWEQGSENSRNPRDAKPVPLKKDDHAVDALRYLLFSEEQYTGAQIGGASTGFQPKDYGIHQGGRASQRPLDRLNLGQYRRRGR